VRRLLALAFALGSMTLTLPQQPFAAALPLPEMLTPERAAQRRLYNPSGLRAFFAALARLEAGRSRRPLRILQIGDSHTANDAFSGRMREVLQARFGDGGRGWLPIGIPFKYYRPRLVTVTETGWRHLGGRDPENSLPFGLDAALAESVAPGATMRLASDDPVGFDRVAIEYVTRPQGGVFAVAADGRPPVRIATAARAAAVRRIEIRSPPHAQAVVLRVLGRTSVMLAGWTGERGRGVIYENHGTIGATAALLGRLDAATVRRELLDSRPALLIVAFGTNEGFDDGLDREHYGAMFRAAVEQLRRDAPEASVLVLGPADGNRRKKACDAVAACDAAADARGQSCDWAPPPNLDAVRAAQEKAASRSGWAFWNWSQAMGGACSMHRLVEREPPWAYPDHVHLNRAGYAAAADVLLYDLFNEYRDWRRRLVPRRGGG
jgi:lysophospholipase L1-like esterase